jgi:hypothetical protein
MPENYIALGEQIGIRKYNTGGQKEEFWLTENEPKMLTTVGKLE